MGYIRAADIEAEDRAAEQPTFMAQRGSQIEK